MKILTRISTMSKYKLRKLRENIAVSTATTEEKQTVIAAIDKRLDPTNTTNALVESSEISAVD